MRILPAVGFALLLPLSGAAAQRVVSPSLSGAAAQRVVSPSLSGAAAQHVVSPSLSGAAAQQAVSLPLPGAAAQQAVSLPLPETAAQRALSRPSPEAAAQHVVYRPLSGVAPPLPLSSSSRVEQGGGHRLSLAGGIAGFVVGAAAGGLAACHFNRDSYGVFCAGQSDTKLVIGAALGGAAGAALGAYLFRRER